MDHDNAQDVWGEDDLTDDQVDQLVQAAAASVRTLLDECLDHDAGLANVYRRARRADPVPSSQRLWGAMLPNSRPVLVASGSRALCS
jgi:hypothetical protein